MMIQSKTGRPMFKYWVPMSVGVWALLILGACTFLTTLGGLHETGRIRWRMAGRLTQGPIATVVAIVGGIAGFFIAGYTGVLLSVTNRPIWADSSWLGALYLLSAASSAAAVLILLASRRRETDAVTLGGLERFDNYVLVLELVVLIVFLVSLGSVARVFLSVWGGVLLIIVVAGILVPLMIGFGRLTRFRGRTLTAGTAAGLVLLGGFMLRIATIIPSEQVKVVGTQVRRP
jgi:formate-dependent nitrite reductase membrane component NrfD